MSRFARYSRLTIALHWGVLLLIAVAYAAIELRGEFPRGSAARDAMKLVHFNAGLLVFVLLWLRLYARWRGPNPPVTPPLPRWQAASAQVMHLALYAFLLAMPLLGWALRGAEGDTVSLLGLPLPALVSADEALAHTLEDLHETIGKLGYALIGLHAAAALFHHLLRRDDTLRRMLPGAR